MLKSIRTFTRSQRAVLIVTLLYASGFYAWYIFRGDSEFMLYLFEFFAFVAVACFLLARVPDFPTPLLALLSLVGFLHVIAGGLSVGGTTLYSLHLVTLYDGGTPDLYILKYDQFEHLLGFGAVALTLRWLLAHGAEGLSAAVRSAFAIFATLGLGALNEISEFLAVVAFSRTGVGGYYNLSLDLVFNLAGAVLAILLAEAYARFCQRREHLLDFESRVQTRNPLVP